MVDNTHKDPAKSVQPYNCGNKGSDPVVDILTEILDKICKLELPDLSGILTIVAQLQAICDKLLALPDYTASFEALCTKLEGIADVISKLCEKIEGSNQEMCDKLQNILTVVSETQTCLNQIKALSVEQLACLKDLKAQGLTLQECLDKIKQLNSDQLECLVALKDQGLSIIDCLEILKDLSYTECCVEADPENRDRWCFADNRTYPVGNGASTTIYSVQVDGGGYITLPNPYTQAQLIAALNQANPSANFTAFDGQICRYDGDGAVQFRTITCSDRLKGIGQSTASTNFVDGEDPECKKYLDVLGKYDEPIADDIANIDTNLSQLLQKFCDAQADCLNCAKFTIDPELVVNNVITGVQGSSGGIRPLESPATGPIEFAAAVTALGYTVDSVIGNEVTVCGVDIIFSYQTADETVVPADELSKKKGQLVCDPGGTAALCGKLDQLIAIETSNNQKLCDIHAALICKADPPNPTCTVSVSSPNNPVGYSWITGPNANQPVVFPTQLGIPETQDLAGTVTTDCAELAQCFPNCAEAERVRLRVTFSHRQLGPGHSGFIFSAGPGASVVAVSPNNTTSLTPSNSTTQQIGTAIGDPDDAGYVDRWVEVLVPRATLCGEGWNIATGGFEGFDTVSVFDESLQSITIDIIGCE